MCSNATSSPHTAQVRWYRIRPMSLSWSWLNLRLFSSVAGYRRIGTVTRPKEIAPFHIVLGIAHLRGRPLARGGRQFYCPVPPPSRIRGTSAAAGPTPAAAPDRRRGIYDG